MRPLIRFFFTFILLLALLTTVGCASTPSQAENAEYADDTAINSKIKTMLSNEPSFSSDQINVETFMGEVELTGIVRSSADMDIAIDIARSVPGVKSVKNNLQIK